MKRQHEWTRSGWMRSLLVSAFYATFATACASASGSPNTAVAAGAEAAAAEFAAQRDAHQLNSVRQVMTSNQELFEACYIAQAEIEGSHGGIVRLRLAIDQDGHVTHARIAESNLGMAQAETCMLDVAGELLFEKPSNEKAFVLHFSFMFFAAGTPQEQAPMAPSPRHSRPKRRMKEGLALLR